MYTVKQTGSRFNVYLNNDCIATVVVMPHNLGYLVFKEGNCEIDGTTPTDTIAFDDIYGFYTGNIDNVNANIRHDLCDGYMKQLVLKQHYEMLKNRITVHYQNFLSEMCELETEFKLEPIKCIESTKLNDWVKDFCIKFPGIGETVVSKWFASVMAIGYNLGKQESSK